LTPELAQLGVDHIYDLVAVAVGPTRDAAHLARQGGVQAARLHAIKGDILANPGEHALSLNALASRYAISPVYVRKLFDREGLSFSRFVLEQRLQLARRLLTDRRHHALRIAVVALDAGFDDLSYFNRVFRRRFGMTPTTMRVESMKELD
jgi:AraC-like DNA-binding protein